MLLKIKDIEHPYSSDALYLKVEETGKEEIIVAVLQKKEDYTNSMYQLEKIYNLNKNYLSQLPVKLSDLKKHILPITISITPAQKTVQHYFWMVENLKSKASRNFSARLSKTVVQGPMAILSGWTC
ncbi:MAG: hypothetical protein HC830_07880 [Bacteroidetes bacterium]|nr:hypothetical protein [Bacteroidota bacterium]